MLLCRLCLFEFCSARESFNKHLFKCKSICIMINCTSRRGTHNASLRWRISCNSTNNLCKQRSKVQHLLQNQNKNQGHLNKGETAFTSRTQAYCLLWKWFKYWTCVRAPAISGHLCYRYLPEKKWEICKLPSLIRPPLLKIQDELDQTCWINAVLCREYKNNHPNMFACRVFF